MKKLFTFMCAFLLCTCLATGETTCEEHCMNPFGGVDDVFD